MEENFKEEQTVTATIPEQDDIHENFSLSVRFNKEDVNLDYESAVSLAQKGMKFELIENDFSRIKGLAKENGKTLSQYISDLESERAEKHKSALLKMCGGNEELCNKMIELEGKKEPAAPDISEISTNFPEIDSIEKLPKQVIEDSALKGTNLLDEYLRYLLKTERAKREIERKDAVLKNASTGSQQAGGAVPSDLARNEFIKGIWERN